MVQKKSGLGGLKLKQLDDEADTSLAAALSSGTSTVRVVALDDVADNPENPPARTDDIEQLAESMKQVGQLQPGLVVSAREFLSSYPEHAEAIGSRRWVLLAGHRRKAAAAAASLGTIEVLERTSARMDEAVLHENLHRRALSPLEEAASFRRVMERNGLSQRQMAEHAGVSQSYLAKRMRLLELPAVFQAAVDAEAIAPSVGVELVREHDAETLQEAARLVEERDTDLADDWALKSVFRMAAARMRSARALSQAQELAAAEGVSVIEDPDAQFGAWKLHEHTLRSAEEIEAARERGDLAYVPAQGFGDEPVAVRTSTEHAAEQSDDPRKAAERRKKHADQARFEFLVQLAAKKPPAGDAMRVLGLAALTGAHIGSQVTTQARKIAQAAGVGPQQGEDWPWREALLEESATVRERLAWICALASLNEPLRSPFSGSWRPQDVEFFAFLLERGYEPSEHETQELSRATATMKEQS